MKKFFQKKYLISVLLAAVTLVSMTACGNKKNDNQNNSTNPIQEMVTNAVDDVSRAVNDVIDGTLGNNSGAAGNGETNGITGGTDHMTNGTNGMTGGAGGIGGDDAYGTIGGAGTADDNHTNGAAGRMIGGGADDWRSLDEMMSDAAYDAPNGRVR